MNILLTGGSGQVGFELRRSLAIAGALHAPDRRTLDLTDEAAVAQWLKEVKPDLIVNAAAYTAVDTAESEPEVAWRLNADLPRQLASYAGKSGARLVHYSSDYVYPGTGDTYLNESAETSPPNTYGQSKLGGDKAIMESGCRHLIFRTSWVYSARGKNFMKTMLRLGQERQKLNVVSDQIGAPTPARLIAETTALCLSRQEQIPSGVYHLAPKGETSWHGFAKLIFEQARVQGYPLRIDPADVKAITTEQYPTPARRPLNSRLDTTRLEQALGTTLPGWQEQLALTIEELTTLSP